MCDTMVALPPVTLSGAVLFAKNSDRERNEGQPFAAFPRATHAAGSRLRCTYIDIPQVAETHATLLSRPYWCWGAEIGANEHGVVIGNEAMVATLAPGTEKKLIGMDLVRLGLERAATAAEAVEVITSLLEAHGQGGPCGHLHEHYYDNGYIIADRREAFVLETIGTFWAVERVAGFRALSNAFSIGRGAIWRAGGGLLEHARAAGFCTALDDLDLADRYLSLERDAISQGRARCSRATELLGRDAPRLTSAHLMAALRDHGAAAERDPRWHPAHLQGRSICMHAGEGLRRSQSTASMVSELRGDGRVLHWATASSAPCLSIFKPVLPGLVVPEAASRGGDSYDATSLWWRHERLHRAAERGDFAAVIADFAPQRDRLEAAFRIRIEDVLGAPAPEQQAAMDACWAEAATLEARVTAALPEMPDAEAAHAGSWRELDRRAGLPLLCEAA
ncbi:C69 family dipeptidase [Roseomonas sp. 18066]|uniref:C69 family dipeptidase n=1 Tax=Roseomonas sp. 18066 TaxID=2681412 RepID=UPI0013589A00|nr:C69 family dipeptidase [Roseomonas sp. 18066]